MPLREARGQRPTVLVEACVDSVQSAIAAETGGAQRLELCASLNDGGTTPSAGTIAAIKAHVAIPVFVIVRPRGGDFFYDAHELDVTRRDIAVALDLGADGLVIGALGPDARIDHQVVRSLLRDVGAVPITFHRAFDVAADLDDALDALVSLGIRRVLTSGGAMTALEGVHRLASLVTRAAGRIEVMAGGGIRAEHVETIVRQSGVREIHVRGTRVRPAHMPTAHARVRFRKPFPDDEGAWEETDAEAIRRIVAAAAR